MAKWKQSATMLLQEVEISTGANNTQMDDLRREIANWADRQPDYGTIEQRFRITNILVVVLKSDGWIVQVIPGPG